MKRTRAQVAFPEQYEAAKKRRMASKARAGGYATRRIVSYNPKRNLPGNLVSNRPEIKAVDIPVTSWNINTTAQIVPINLIQAGSTFCNRIGRKVEMASVRVSGMIRPAGNTTTVQDYARVLIVYDRQTNGALPAISDILQTTNQSTTNTTTSFSGININNRDRFTILRDNRYELPTVTDTAGVLTNKGLEDQAHSNYMIDQYIKLGNLCTQYKADSNPAVIGDIATGALFLVIFGSAASGSEGFTFEAELRLRYYDL